jgi:hypothetical protein
MAQFSLALSTNVDAGMRDDFGTVAHLGGVGAPQWQRRRAARIGVALRVNEVMMVRGAPCGGGKNGEWIKGAKRGVRGKRQIITDKPQSQPVGMGWDLTLV